MRKYVLTFLLLLSYQLAASEIKLSGELTQGSLIRGQLPAGSQLWLNEQQVKVSADGYFAFGFGRDALLKQKLSWQTPEGEKQSKQLELTKRTYQEQRI